LDAAQDTRPRAFLAGLGAGLILAVADCAATGIAILPGSLALASLGLGAVLGSGAGLVAAVLGRTMLGPGLVLAAGVGLEGLSIASKELEGIARPIAAALVVLVAFASLAGVLALRPGTGRMWASSGALACLSSGAYLAGRFTESPWSHLTGILLPLLVLLVARWSEGRRARLGLVFAVLVLLGATRRERPPPPRPPLPGADVPAASGPSLVVLVIDTLRADALDPEGELARFARGGVDFRQCASAAPWTLPAIGSLLTGLVPSQHGALTATTSLAEDVTTLAELLRARGYATAAFTGGAFVGAAHHLDQGFEHFDSRCERRFAPFHAHVPLVWRLAKNRYFPLRRVVRWVDENRGFEGVVAAARAWGAERSASDTRPFFVLLHTYQVHDYYIYDPPVDDGVLEDGPGFSERFAGRLSVHPSELTAAAQADLDVFRRFYQGRVRAVEARLPELERWVREVAGEDAVFVVTADHGEGFDAARRRVHHGGRLHEDLLRVPLLVRARGRLPEGRVVEDTVRSVDVLPTVLDLLGLPVPAGLAGESLLPALRGERAFPASAFSEEHARGIDLLALRREGWKWIRGRGRAELYRLEQDPLEAAPLPGEPPETLRTELEAFPTRFPARSSAEIELDPATLEHLRALGYVR
jgi:arylsulfatase A-like enzyme